MARNQRGTPLIEFFIMLNWLRGYELLSIRSTVDTIAEFPAIIPS